MARLKNISYASEYQSLRNESDTVGEKNDCSVVAVASACGVPYAEAHAALKKFGREDGKGTPQYVTRQAISHLGFDIKEWNEADRDSMIATYPGAHKNLRSITTHHPRRFPEAWAGCHPNLLFFTCNHVLSVVDGEVKDWSINSALRVTRIMQVEKRT